jgi:hypothetical protein
VAYHDYRVLWTGKKDNTEGCCIQVGEVQLLGTATPEPGTFVLAGLGALGLLVVARRRGKA